MTTINYKWSICNVASIQNRLYPTISKSLIIFNRQAGHTLQRFLHANPSLLFTHNVSMTSTIAVLEKQEILHSMIGQTSDIIWCIFFNLLFGGGCNAKKQTVARWWTKFIFVIFFPTKKKKKKKKFIFLIFVLEWSAKRKLGYIVIGVWLTCFMQKWKISSKLHFTSRLAVPITFI